MRKAAVLFTIVTLSFFSFISDRNVLEFNYPKNKDAVFTMNTKKFRKFKKEWRGEDYYYLCDKGDNGIICSVLFLKLNENEQKTLVDERKKFFNFPESSPGYAFAYFLNNSNLKEFESNKQKWGDPTNDFMFSQSEIKEMQGFKINQKNMNAYAMFGKDLFVNVHLSKTGYTRKDSITMRGILETLAKKR